MTCVARLVILGRGIQSVLVTVAFVRLIGSGRDDNDDSVGMHR